MSTQTPSDARSAFFVGYLPMPGPLVRFSLLAGTALVGLLWALGFAAGASQRSPAETLAPAKPGHEQAGALVMRPYPHLRHLDAEGRVRSLLLAGGGKTGVSFSEEDQGGALVLQGLLLARAGTRLLDGAGTSDAKAEIGPETLQRLRTAPATPLGRVTLRGEIVDSKCFLGRMRPGRGRVHRGCAQYCIQGGIPPLLATWDENGAETHYLLTSRDGGPIGEAVLPFVAEPVAVTGDLNVRAGLNVLAIDQSDIQRQ